jgi:hypothetical protein
MGIQTKQKRINDHTYEVVQFGAKQANRVLVSLVKMLGGSLAELVSAPGDVEARLSVAVGALQKSLSADDLEAMCEAFASRTTLVLTAQSAAGPQTIKTPLAGIFDEHFSGDNYPSLFQWLAFAIEFNYASFISGGKGLAGSLAALGVTPVAP